MEYLLLGLTGKGPRCKVPSHPPMTVFEGPVLTLWAPGPLLRPSQNAQMLGDEQRGWAWTRALLGVPANEIHICGDGSAVELVTGLASAMGEELEVHLTVRNLEKLWVTLDT